MTTAELSKVLLTVDEAAEVLSVSKATVYDLIRLLLLATVKIGKRRRVPAGACHEMVQRLLEEDPL